MVGLSSSALESGSANMIFDSDDDDASTDNVFSYAKANQSASAQQQNNLGDIIRGKMEESEGDLLEETHM